MTVNTGRRQDTDNDMITKTVSALKFTPEMAPDHDTLFKKRRATNDDEPVQQEPPSDVRDDVPTHVDAKSTDVKNDVRKIRAWWVNGVFVILVHVASLFALLRYTPKYETKWLTYWSWQLSTLGITLGYHRLWSHRAYTARLPLRVVLAAFGTCGFQGSIKWWCLRHRLHHRFTDTEEDPYSAKKGFWFSHILWIFTKPQYTKMKMIDQSDLDADPVVQFQHKHYVALALLTGFVVPTVIAASWGDALGGFLYGALIARVLVWHATFSINSFAHWIGDQLYSEEVSARGNLWLAIFTNGEGYHNFHHEFPKDYRNGLRAWDWDPSKWCIYLLHRFTNQVPTLARAPENEVLKARTNMELLRLQRTRARLDWGSDPAKLPVVTTDEFQRRVRDEGCEWIAIDEFVLDVAGFKDDHPGGTKLLRAYYGRDASKAFHGGLNNHTRAARMMLAMFRVARLDDSGVNVARRQNNEQSVAEGGAKPRRLG